MKGKKKLKTKKTGHGQKKTVMLRRNGNVALIYFAVSVQVCVPE